MVQQLILYLPMKGMQVQSLVGELKSHMSHGQKVETQNRNSVAANSIKTLKTVHIKKKS